MRMGSSQAMAECAIAWLARPARRSPYGGLDKTNAWVKRRAVAVNVKRVRAPARPQVSRNSPLMGRAVSSPAEASAMVGIRSALVNPGRNSA
jgi:hypothetical protein